MKSPLGGTLEFNDMQIAAGSRYGRIRYVGETFIEYPSVSYGRRWLDVSVTEMDFELWAGCFHLTLSLTREQCPFRGAVEAARAYLATRAKRIVR